MKKNYLYYKYKLYESSRDVPTSIDDLIHYIGNISEFQSLIDDISYDKSHPYHGEFNSIDIFNEGYDDGELQSTFDYYYSQYIKPFVGKDKIHVWRVIGFNDDLNMSKIGNCWATDPYGCHNYLKESGFLDVLKSKGIHNVTILEGDVDYDNVNWFTTYLLKLQGYQDEDEVRLIDGNKVRITNRIDTDVDNVLDILYDM